MIMIKREAILHIPLSQYAFANTESNLTIRLRTAWNDVTRVVLWYGDRVPPSNPSRFIPVQMDKIMSAGLFDYFDATFETPFERVCYYFQLIGAEETLYYYAEQTEEIPPRETDDCYQYPYIRREELGWEPRWFQEAIVYNIFPDSFVSEKEEMNAVGGRIPWERGIQLESRLGGDNQ
ncbi:alpha amylase N-terminal ig-like domain-containing protein [Solobacterium moorei]|uniref:alpha amylase N-terminal ig-like domain-containing protein n=1 Tax=Solobacterium moorei TaxID=102148 RepID=UPI0028E937D7|nr:alpha amylase N-terminal ig-like domain-containing protein [Solobacterium moorei]